MRDEIQSNAAEGTVAGWELAQRVNELELTGQNGMDSSSATMMMLNDNEELNGSNVPSVHRSILKSASVLLVCSSLK